MWSGNLLNNISSLLSFLIVCFSFHVFLLLGGEFFYFYFFNFCFSGNQGGRNFKANQTNNRNPTPPKKNKIT